MSNKQVDSNSVNSESNLMDMVLFRGIIVKSFAFLSFLFFIEKGKTNVIIYLNFQFAQHVMFV